MTKLKRDTPEWRHEWAKCAQLTEALKLAPGNANLKAALRASAEKLGFIVPVAAPDSVTH
jgi:hypothetical protein